MTKDHGRADTDIATRATESHEEPRSALDSNIQADIGDAALWRDLDALDDLLDLDLDNLDFSLDLDALDFTLDLSALDLDLEGDP